MHVKKIGEYLDDLENEEMYIVVQVPYELEIPDKERLIVEGRWVSSGYKDFLYRLDQPNFDFEQLHVHIAHEKNKTSKNMQVAWNKDGTRHDRKTFDVNFNGLVTAKTIARDVLGLPEDSVLENLNSTGLQELILESADEGNTINQIYFLELKND